MDCEHINITILGYYVKIPEKTRQSAFILLHEARYGHRTEKDTHGAAYHSATRKKHVERRMPIDKQRDYAVEGQDRIAGKEIRNVRP